jgi:hypothetical protein
MIACIQISHAHLQHAINYRPQTYSYVVVLHFIRKKEKLTKLAHIFRSLLPYIFLNSKLSDANVTLTFQVRALMLLLTEYREFKCTALSSFQWHNVHTKFYAYRITGSKLEHGDLISLLSSLKKGS